MRKVNLFIAGILLASTAFADTIITVPANGWWLQSNVPDTIPNYQFNSPLGLNDSGASFFQEIQILDQFFPLTAEYTTVHQCSPFSPGGCTFDLTVLESLPNQSIQPSHNNAPEPGTVWFMAGAGIAIMAVGRKRRS